MERLKIRIGTRNSPLALRQAHHVASLLSAGGFHPEPIPIETKGDKILNVTLSKIGSKGIFTQELETSLKNGTIDIAVHSAKDVPSTLPEGFRILSFCKRESPEDVIVADKEIDFDSPKLVLGTSSTRRIALLKHFYPHVKTINVRGNLQTRMEKLKTGQIQGLVLAWAGIKRMRLEHTVKHRFDMEQFPPSIGQGAIAIEIHDRLAYRLTKNIKALTNHALTEKLIQIERTFLKKMDGGCSIPVFGWAKMEKKEQMKLTGGIASLDGKQLIKRILYGANKTLGTSLANEILANGGKKILDDIKSSI